MNCPGSVALSHGIEEREKDYAAEGTDFHSRVAEALIARARPETISDEHVHTCVAEAVNLGAYEARELYIEHRLPYLGSSGGIDLFWFDEPTKTIYVLDWKYGVGKRVSAYNNEQLAFYLCALKDKFPKATKAHATIIQPRLEGDLEDSPAITSWVWSWREFKFWRQRFEQGLSKVDKGEEFKPGDWCGFCKARAICPSYTAYTAFTERETALVPVGDNTPVDIPRVAFLLSQRSRVESWFKKAEEYLLTLAMNGATIPGFELSPKRANRKWKDIPKDILIDTLMARGVENPIETSIISLTKAEKVCDISDLVEKPDNGMTLKLIKDK